MKAYSEHLVAEWNVLRSRVAPNSATVRVLARLLRIAAHCEFGRSHGLAETMTLDEFRRAVPIRDYSGYRPWLDRVLDGEHDVLWTGRPYRFVTTSGTTTTPKTIPITRDFIRDYHLPSHLTFHRFISHRPRAAFGKVLALGGPGEERQHSGIPVGSITGVLYETLPAALAGRLAIPSFVHNIQDANDRLYVLARLSVEQDVTNLISISPVALLVLADVIRQYATEFVGDIGRGLIRPIASITPQLNQRLARSLVPNAARATFLAKCLRRDGTLRPKDVWNVQGLCTYSKSFGGSVRSQIRQLFGEFPVIDTGLVASEGRASVGLVPDSGTSAVIPMLTLVEFAEADLEGGSLAPDAPTVMASELEAGRLYTPILSSSNGLLRYHVGDVVRAVPSFGGRVDIEYVGRLDGSLSCVGEKMTDAHFRAALDEAGFRGDSYTLWTAAIEWRSGRPRYVLWLEAVTGANADVIDKALQAVNVSYARKRQQRLIERVDVRLMPRAAWMTGREDHRLGQSKVNRLVQHVEDGRTFPMD